MAIDLHLHTTYSDGTSTPQQLVDEAKAAGLTVIAITDHDTVDAVEPALQHAKDIEIIPGIELGCLYHVEPAPGPIEILGYWVDHRTGWSDELLALDSQAHNVRAKIRSLRPQNAKITGSYEFEPTQQRVTLHLEAAGEPLSYAYRIPTAAEAIAAIYSAGGVPILAHPLRYKFELDFAKLADLGLAGIEVFYNNYTDEQIEKLLQIADKHNLLATGGSDYHGLVKPSVWIGKKTLPADHLERLREFRLHSKAGTKAAEA